MRELRRLEEITGWLDGAGGLSESLLDELTLTRHGYSVHLALKVIIDRDGQVLDKPLRVTFDLDGVHLLSLCGGLTPSMVDHPERINWGLSEVALVRVVPHPRGVLFEALWEDTRKVEVICAQVSMIIPIG